MFPDAAQLVWTEPKCNGSKVTRYILRGKGAGDEFAEIYRGKALAFLVTDLIPDFVYSFELYAG